MLDAGHEIGAIANVLGEKQWANRASGKLGLIAFLEGNPGRAARLLGGAPLSTMANGDTVQLMPNRAEKREQRMNKLVEYERRLGCSREEQIGRVRKHRPDRLSNWRHPVCQGDGKDAPG